PLDLESVLLQDSYEIFRRLEFLIAQFGIAKNLVDHLLRRLPHALDVAHGVGLEAVQPNIRWRHSGPDPGLTFLQSVGVRSYIRRSGQAHKERSRAKACKKANPSCVRHRSSPSISSSPMSTTTLWMSTRNHSRNVFKSLETGHVDSSSLHAAS